MDQRLGGLFFTWRNWTWSRLDQMIEDLLSTVLSAISNAVPQLLSLTSNLVSIVVTLVLSLVFSIYMLGEGPPARLMPLGAPGLCAGPGVRRGAGRPLTAGTFSKFVTGQVTEACILGALTFAGMVILRLNYPFSSACSSAYPHWCPLWALTWVPLPRPSLLVMIDPMKAVIFLVFLVCLQQFEGNAHLPQSGGYLVGPARHLGAGSPSR